MEKNMNINGGQQGIYNLKALCALFVVIYHVPMLWGAQLTPLAGVAVPCFFMISGYFLYSGIQNEEIKKARRWIKKILFIILFLNVFYLFVNYESVVRRYESSCDFYIPMLFHGGLISGVLWYLTAFWEALVVFIIVRCFSSKLFYVAPLFVLLGLYAGKYGFLFGRCELRPWLFQSFLAAAIPYMSIGYLVHKHKAYFCGCQKWLEIFILFMFLIYIERWVLINYFADYNGGTFYFFTMPLALSLFVFALNAEKIALKRLSWIGKYHSSNIYFFHMFVSGCIAPVFVCLVGEDVYCKTAALIVYICSIVFSCGINMVYSGMKNVLRRKFLL